MLLYKNIFFKEHLQWLLLTVSGSSLQLYSLKETLAKMFICEFCKIFKNIFRQNTSWWLLCEFWEVFQITSFKGHLWETAYFMHTLQDFNHKIQQEYFTSAFQAFYTRAKSSYSKAFIYLKSLKIIRKKVNMWWSYEMANSEAVDRRCSIKMVFLKISQNSQENTCARDSFFK